MGYDLIDVYRWSVKDDVKDRSPFLQAHRLSHLLPSFSETSKSSKKAMAYVQKQNQCHKACYLILCVWLS